MKEMFNKERIKFELQNPETGTIQAFTMTRDDLETRADEIQELKTALELYSDSEVIKTTVKKSHLYFEQGGESS